MTADATHPHPTPLRLTRMIALGALLSVLGCVLVVAAGPILTDDLWWHLAMGRAYTGAGPWLAADPLLHTAHASGPVQHEWLFGVLVHGIERLAGFHGLRVAHGLAVVGIASLAYASFRRQTRGSELAALATTCFLVLAWWRLMQARPDLASIAATLVCFRLLIDSEFLPSWSRVACVAVLVGVWANLHSLFAIIFPLGLAAILGLVARSAAAKRLPAVAGADPFADGFADDLARAGRVGIGLAAAGIASLLNPRGLEQHLTFFRSSSSAAIWQVRDEWRSFDPFRFDAEHESLGLLEWGMTDLVLVAFGIAAVVGGLRFLRAPSARRLGAVDPVLFALGCASIVAMLTSVRFLWLGFFPLLAVARALRDSFPVARIAPVAAATAVAIAIAFPLTSTWPVVRATQPDTLRALVHTPYLGHKFGVPGVQLLRDAGIEGNLFNSYGAGGFLGYWLSPALRTFVDGRTEHYAPEVFDDYLAVVRRNPAEPRGLQTILDERDVDVFFGFGFPNSVPRHGMRPTTGHLVGNDDWIPVSRSVLHQIWLRRGDDTNLERVRAYYAAHAVPFDPERGFDAARVLERNAEWAVRSGMVPAEYPALAEAYAAAAERAPREALHRLAVILTLVGAYEDQLEIEDAIDRAYGADARSLRRTVYAQLMLGRYDRANKTAQALSLLAPGDPRSEAVTKAAGQLAFHRVRVRVQPDWPLPVGQLDGFPLLDREDQEWILDTQRSLAVARSAEAP